MNYTVTQVAKLSGISISTLHYYHEIGLLIPDKIMQNGYRYYKKEQLFLLQQILFSTEFDKLVSLKNHRNTLLQNIAHSHKLIETIDKTIEHLEGNFKMKDEELYYGFDAEKQKDHEKYLAENNLVSQEFLGECNKKIMTWSDNEKHIFINDIKRIMHAIVVAIHNKIKPAAKEVQQLMHEHYLWLKLTWTPTKDSYLGLTELYQTPEFRKFFDKFDSELLAYLIKAMKIYASKLS